MFKFQPRKLSENILLTEHPRRCPVPLNKVVVCGLDLKGIYRSGFKAGHGQFKNYCHKHGFIYYDLVTNKPPATTEEVN